MKCPVCQIELELSAPIYFAHQSSFHPWLDGKSRWLRVCETCSLVPVNQGSMTYPLQAYSDWRDPLPCEHCGRPIITCVGDRMPLHLRCSAECDAAAKTAAAPPKPERWVEQRACQCGRLFTPKRSDAIHCSTACKQRAYRRAHHRDGASP
jgi:hypothetical protein